MKSTREAPVTSLSDSVPGLVVLAGHFALTRDGEAVVVDVDVDIFFLQAG